MTSKECGNNAHLEQNKVLLCSSSAFYLALEICSKNLIIVILFRSNESNGLFKLWPYSIYDGSIIINLVGETHIHNIDAKSLKANDLNSTYLWHLRLSNIRKKCMKKFHTDGLLESFDFETCDACKPFSNKKMTRTPFIGQELNGRLAYWKSYMLMYVVHYV